MPYLQREQFPGATGAAWPAQWAQAASATGSSATQQGLQGRLASGTLTAYNGSHAMYAVLAPRADNGIVTTFNASAVTDDFILELWLRCTTNSAFDSGTGYFIQVAPSLGNWQLNKAVAFTYTQLGTTQTKTFAANTDYRVRIQTVGTTVRARVWTAAVSEPTTWDISVTDSAISAAGSVVINFHGGNTGTDTINLKNILIDDGNFDESGTELFGRRRNVQRIERRSGYLPNGTGPVGIINVPVAQRRLAPRPHRFSRFTWSKDDLFPPPSVGWTATTTDDAGSTDSIVVARNIVLNITDDAGSTDSFAPNEITGLAFWLNAESIAQASGSSVTSWTDQSGAGLTVTQATGSKQPTLIAAGLNNRPVVRFDGGDALTNAASAAVTSGEFTAFVVAKETSAVNGWAVFNGNGGGYALGLNGAGTNRELLLRGQADVVGSAYTPSTAEIWEADRTATGPLSTLRVNGTSDATSAANFSAASGGLVVGAYESAAASFFIGDIGEVVLYSRQLTASERARVTRYLSMRWGITAAEGESRISLDKVTTVTVTDETGSTDSATLVSTYVRTNTDSAGSTDALTTLVDRGVPRTDDAGSTDSAVVAVGRALAQTDSAGSTDSAVVSAGFGVNRTDDAGVSDSAVLSHGYGISTTDSAGSTDSAALVAVYARPVTDDAGSTDSVVLSIGRGVNITDDAGSVDSFATARGYGVLVTDSAGSTDSAAVVGTYVQSRTDDAGSSDTVVVSVGRAASNTDDVGSTDAVSFAVARVLNITDDAGSSDAVVAGLSAAGAISVTEDAGSSDAVSFDRGLVLADTAGSTDSVVVGLGHFVTITDAAGSTDALSQDRILSQTDSAGSTDAVVLAVGHGLALSDDASTVDSLALARGYGLAPVDSAGSSDAVLVENGRLQALADTAGTSDAVVLSIGRGVPIVDSAGSSDSVTIGVDYVLNISDSAGSTDAAVIGLAQSLARTDDAGSSDALVLQIGRTVTALDSAGSSDSVALVVDHQLIIGDSAGSDDQLTVADQHVLTRIDDAGVSDSVVILKQHTDRDVTVVIAVGDRHWSATVARDRLVTVEPGERDVVAASDPRSVTATVGQRRWTVEAGEQNG